jgi:nucleotide-binding universal stress UspA family protein
MTLVHVIEWPWHEPPAPRFDQLPTEQAAALDEYRRYADASARGRLEGLVPADADTPVSVEVAHGKPYVEILRTAFREPTDLIVIGVHGRSVPDLALFGSTANQVVRRATCPVLTLRS